MKNKEAIEEISQEKNTWVDEHILMQKGDIKDVSELPVVVFTKEMDVWNNRFVAFALVGLPKFNKITKKVRLPVYYEESAENDQLPNEITEEQLRSGLVPPKKSNGSFEPAFIVSPAGYAGYYQHRNKKWNLRRDKIIPKP